MADYTPPPPDFGAPSKFSSWRNGQDDLFWDILDNTKDLSIHSAPVGMGKSLAYLTAALASGKRVAFLTESKGLQDQIARDFKSIGLFDMRGLGNYDCRALAKGGHLESIWNKKWGRPTCEHGPCASGLNCDLREAGCDYFDAYRRASAMPLVQTNYAYWIAIHKYGQGLGKFDMLVLDEAHCADSALSSALSVEFNFKDIKELGGAAPKAGATLQAWRLWGRVQLAKVQGKLEFFSQSAKIGTNGPEGFAFSVDSDVPDASELKFWKKLESKCQTLSDSTDDWILERNEVNDNVKIAPAWVRKYANDYLFLNIPRIVMLSGTVRPKTAELLGRPAGTYRFTEYPSTFPVARRPIYWLPTARINKDVSNDELRTWIVHIDRILAGRLDRKGIIHSVSYDRARYLKEHSRFGHLMLVNNKENTQNVVQSFRDAVAPAILVSPSVGTGFDFSFDFARYQIVCKVPFKDPRGEILKAQAKEDPNYLNYLTSQDLIQMYGRTNRDPRDFSETFIVDDSIEWFLKQCSNYHYDKPAGRFNMREQRHWKDVLDFFPYYFLEAFERVNSVPVPPTVEMMAV